tara:strand:+ start:1764 stop:1910 length:147 start_codon:yes stop_codon:yes gene_type:complete
MKKILLILFFLAMIGYGQQNYVPDDQFEADLENHGISNVFINNKFILQ